MIELTTLGVIAITTDVNTVSAEFKPVTMLSTYETSYGVRSGLTPPPTHVVDGQWVSNRESRTDCPGGGFFICTKNLITSNRTFQIEIITDHH